VGRGEQAPQLVLTREVVLVVPVTVLNLLEPELVSALLLFTVAAVGRVSAPAERPVACVGGCAASGSGWT
jgi:hypothetical protein